MEYDISNFFACECRHALRIVQRVSGRIDRAVPARWRLPLAYSRRLLLEAIVEVMPRRPAAQRESSNKRRRCEPNCANFVIVDETYMFCGKIKCPGIKDRAKCPTACYQHNSSREPAFAGATIRNKHFPGAPFCRTILGAPRTCSSNLG